MGAVPTRVDIPPSVAAYAIPKSNAVSKYLCFSSDRFGIVSLTTEQTARPMGNNIKVVEVFITNILISAATSIKPPIKDEALLPTERIMVKAILLCKPVASIASANMNPPRNKNILGFE